MQNEDAKQVQPQNDTQGGSASEAEPALDQESEHENAIVSPVPNANSMPASPGADGAASVPNANSVPASPGNGEESPAERR